MVDEHEHRGRGCRHGTRWPSGLERWLGLATGRFPAGFESHCGNFASELWQFRLTRLASVFSEETLKAVGPFYLVCMPGEEK